MMHKKNRKETKKNAAGLRMFSLKRQITGSTWLFMIVVVLLLITFLAGTVSSYQKKSQEKRTEALLSYADTLANHLDELRDVAGEIFSKNSDFDGINIFPSPAEKWTHIYDLMNTLRMQIKSHKGLEGLFLYYDSFEQMQYAVNDTISFDDTERLKKAGKAGVQNGEGSYIAFPYASERDAWYNVYMKKSSAAVGGCVRLSQGLPEDKDENAVYGVIVDGHFYRTWAGEGQEEREEEQEIDAAWFDGLQPGVNHVDGKVIYFHTLKSEDMAVAEILPESIWLYVNWLHIVFAFLIVVYCLAAFRILKFVYEELSRPLEDMTKALAHIRTGVWEVEFSAPNRILEIEDVRQSVKTLLGEIEQYKIRFYEEELEKAKIHRQYLQLQLAPHFYTNCLKNAYYMLALKEYDNAEIFLQRLSVHLRYLLQQNAPFVTVKQELDFVQNYTDMQKLMTTKTLSCKIAAEEDVMEKEIPILTLQTFVENSVKYARDAQGNQLVIDISVKLRKTEEENYLDITVKDNGQGYPQELLDVISQQNPAEKEGMGVGIINLQNRIRIFYGEEASWYFENRGGAFSELILTERPKVQR